MAKGYPVLTLNEALDVVDKGRIPNGAVVITIDDGWVGTFRYAIPILQANNLPATIYVTTYYVEKGLPVFNLLLPYLFWRSKKEFADFSDVCGELAGPTRVQDEKERERAIECIGGIIESLPVERRWEICNAVAQQLEVNGEEIRTKRLFQLMNLNEVKELADCGFDIQLHSHRHLGKKMLHDRRLLDEEISRNRKILSKVANGMLDHYCYPSGFFHSRQGAWLAALGIKSATTTQPGLNRLGESTFTLKRFVDSEGKSDLEFEAELCGLLDFLRRLRMGISGRGQVGGETESV
jgi:hypothetical protein